MSGFLAWRFLCRLQFIDIHLLTSNLVKNQASAIRAIISSVMEWWLRSLGSKQIRSLPLLFSTVTIKFTRDTGTIKRQEGGRSFWKSTFTDSLYTLFGGTMRERLLVLTIKQYVQRFYIISMTCVIFIVLYTTFKFPKNILIWYERKIIRSPWFKRLHRNS